TTLGLGFALLLNERFVGRGLARTLLIVPWAAPWLMVGVMWEWFVGPPRGNAHRPPLPIRPHRRLHPVPGQSHRRPHRDDRGGRVAPGLALRPAVPRGTPDDSTGPARGGDRGWRGD